MARDTAPPLFTASPSPPFLSYIFCPIASIIRFVSLLQINPADQAWTFGKVAVWSELESSVAILCASLPTYGPLIQAVKARYSQSSSITRHQIQTTKDDDGSATIRNDLELRALRPAHVAASKQDATLDHMSEESIV